MTNEGQHCKICHVSDDRGLKEQAKEFRALQKVLMYQGSFKSMQTAMICAGLAEVAEMLADMTKRRQV